MDVNVWSFGALVPAVIVTAFILPILGMVIKKRAFFHVYGSVITAAVALVTTYNLWVVWKNGVQVYTFGGWPPPLGISYEVDLLGAVLSALTGWVLLLIALYSTWYVRDAEGIPYYYTLLLGLEAGLLGCIYTGDAFNLFVMLEVLSISAYALVGYYRRKPEAIEAAVKYGLLGAAATTIYFIALVFLYGAFGTLNMADLAIKSRAVAHSPFSGAIYGAIPVSASVGVALALWAFTYKSALFPNHFWLPDAHPEAPTPVSAALSGLVVNVGAYAVIRFMYTIFGPDSVLGAGAGFRDTVLIALLILGAASGLVGALMMAVQEDIKRLLAYSTISHVGLIFMGISIGLSSVPQEVASVGLAGAIYHIINHSVGKALLFMAAGTLIVAAGGRRKLDDLAGIGRKYPLVTAALFIGFFQLMGLPPFGGFTSKFLLYMAFFEAGLPVISVLIVAISAISVMGYAKVMYSVWFRPTSSEFGGEAGSYVLPSGVVMFMAAICVALGLVSPILTPLISHVVDASVTSSGIISYIQAFLKVATSLGSGG